MENEVEINEIFRRGSSSTTAAGWPSLHVNELSSVSQRASVQTHTLLCSDKVMLEDCSWSHDWHAEWE